MTFQLDSETVAFFTDLFDEAAAIALPYSRLARKGKLPVIDKGGKKNGDLVTPADSEIQAMISDRVRARYPGIDIVGEEVLGDENNVISLTYPRLKFIVDPIDGTRSFAQGQRYWSTCNFALQVQEREDAPWETVLSGAYAPQLDMAALADNEKVLVRNNLLLGDTRFHPLSDLHDELSEPQPVLLDAKALKGTYLDLRLANNDAAEKMMWEELKEKGFTVRNAGSMIVTMLEMLIPQTTKQAIVAGNFGGEWDWRGGEHFLKTAGFKTGLITIPDGGKDGQEYRAFAAASSPELFNHLVAVMDRNIRKSKTQETTEAVMTRVFGR